MANKKELRKIADAIQEIKSQLQGTSRTAGETLNFDSWSALNPKDQKKMLQKLGSRVEKLLGMLGYKVKRVSVQTYQQSHGYGSRDIFWSVVLEGDEDITLYPIGDDGMFSGVDIGQGDFYEEKKFSGGSVEGAFDKYSKWVLSTIAEELN